MDSNFLAFKVAWYLNWWLNQDFQLSISIENQNSGLPSYLSDLISSGVYSYNTQNSEDGVKYLFFPWTILKWKKLDSFSKSSYKIFRNYLLKMIYPSQDLVYDIHKPFSLYLLTRLRLGLRHVQCCTQGYFGQTIGSIFSDCRSTLGGCWVARKIWNLALLECWKMHFPRCFSLFSAMERDKEKQNVW